MALMSGAVEKTKSRWSRPIVLTSILCVSDVRPIVGFIPKHPTAASITALIRSGKATECRGKNAIATSTVIHSTSYGRGAEIWPECNEDPIKLADSFPDGQVPSSFFHLVQSKLDHMRTIYELDDVEDTNDSDGNSIVETADNEREVSASTPEKGKRRSKRKMVSNTIKRILRRAARKEELELEQQVQYLPKAPTTTPMDRTPSVIAILLLVRGLIHPKDILIVTLLTSYFVLLKTIAQLPRRLSYNGSKDDATPIPILPALPPQGHVPTMVSNPMGLTFTYSKIYDRWLKCGVLTGLFGPLLLLSRHLYTKDTTAASLCARPIFLLCCQAISEAFSRRIMAPLPIRILIPIMYNTIRLGYLWTLGFAELSTTATGLDPWVWAGKTLAIANLVYWACNLFVFLIPVASLRYMRAHFFGVEAEEVTTRRGMEETVGLIPHV